MSEEEKQEIVPEENSNPALETETDPSTQESTSKDSKVNESPKYKGDTHTTNFRDDGMWPEYANPNFKMSDEIEVNVRGPTGDYSFPVQIEKSTERKLYYGGYKHSKNKRVYHNASTQTPIESKNVEGGTNLRTRETQTYDMKSISVQPNREHGTQMQRVDLYLDNNRDTEITPKTYFTSEDLLFLKRVKCVEVQRVWRGKMARGRADRMRKTMIANEEHAHAEQ